MIRYSEIKDKNPREIVLLKSSPCKHGKCSFCDYINDNESNIENFIDFNKNILSNVTGKYSALEVINSASVFELPTQTWKDIKKVCIEKDITSLYFECHYLYKNRLKEVYNFFSGINITFKCGIETFDNHFRNDILKKGIYFNTPDEVSKYFKSICLLIGIKGQTEEMIDADIEIALKYFDKICINIYKNNSTPIKEDKHLQKWFLNKYSYLKENSKVELLENITDFGVGKND